MDGKGVPANRGLALRILVLMADNGDLEAQDAIRSMTDYELADCDGEELRSADFPEESWGREVMERIGTVG